MAKHTRGLVAQHLWPEGADAKTPNVLQRVVAQRFETTLARPGRHGQSRILNTKLW